MSRAGLAQRTFVVVLLLGLWQVASVVWGPTLVPGPVLTVYRTVTTALADPLIAAQTGAHNGYLVHAGVTLAWTTLGLTLGICAGVALAGAAASTHFGAAIVYSLVEYVRVLPPLLVIPFLTVLLGVSSRTEVASVATYGFLATSGYALVAMLNVPRSTVALGRLLGASRLRTTWRVVFPAIFPKMQGPMRVVVSLGFGVAVVAEFLAAPAGIGRVMQFAMSYGRADLIVVGVVWAVFLVLLGDAAVSVLWRWAGRGGQWDLLGDA